MLLSKDSISAKITTRMSLVIIVILIIIGVSTNSIVKRFNQQQYNQRLLDSVALMDSGIRDYFTNLSGIITMFTKEEVIRDSSGYITSYRNLTDPSGKVRMDPARMNESERRIYDALGLVVGEFASVEELCVGLDSEGNYIQYPASDRSNNYDCTTRSWYKNAKAKNGQIDISDAYQSSNGLSSILVSRWFTDENGQGRGVVSMTAGLSYFKDLCQSIRDGRREDGYIIVCDKTGTIILDQSNAANNFTNIKDSMPFVEHGVAKEVIETIGGIKSDIRVYPSGNGFVPLDFIMVTPYAVVNEVNSYFTRYMVIMVIVSVLVSLVVAVLMSRSICRPLESTVDVLRGISEGDGDLTQRLTVRGKDEIAQLSEYFNKTFDKISGTISTVITESGNMTAIAENLSSNVTETASAINQIDSNIASIKN